MRYAWSLGGGYSQALFPHAHHRRTEGQRNYVMCFNGIINIERAAPARHTTARDSQLFVGSAAIAMALATLVGLALLVAVASTCGPCQTNGPTSPADQPAWLAQLKSDRDTTLASINYTGGVFSNPSLLWTQSAYIQPQMHPYDRYFYDEKTHSYTVGRFLDDLKTRYGGVDAILMWPTYTNIGIDDRNQFDFFRTMPDGLDGVGKVTKELEEAGVRVLWPYNPWDTGTRREPLDDEHTFAKLLKQTGGDGFNGDTMGFVPESFWQAAEEANYPLAFEAEGGGSDDSLNWNTMGWGYWVYPHVPTVDRFKFLTRGKFMTNVCDRWAFRKTDNLQSAWFNGAGYESWENVWGTWNGIVPRDGEAIRRVAAMLRFWGGPGGLLQSPEWEPHTPDSITAGVFASRFPNATHTLYTAVNRAGKAVTARLLLPAQLVEEGGRAASAAAAATRYFDCYKGVELTPTAAPWPPPSLPKGYQLFGSSNCWGGHGGTEIDEDPATGLSVAECTARCDADTNCSCVAYEAGSSSCWKRAACVPAAFASGAGQSDFDTFVNARRAGPYYAYGKRNAYVGHGASKDIDDDQSAPSGLSVARCQARCDSDAACSCVTFRPKDGSCWKRAGCEAGSFAEANDGQFDVYVSAARHPSGGRAPYPEGSMTVSFDMEEDGYGCALAVEGAPSAALTSQLQTMAALTKTPLQSISANWTYLNQTLVPIAKTVPATAAPPGMVAVPATSSYGFAAKGIEIEGDDDHGVDVQFPWEAHPVREHSQTMALGPFFIDKFPATNANYSAYLAATGYTPRDATGWLKHWGGAATPPAALRELPVTYISLDEARKYCGWAHGGSRLPHSYEWQYAAQGTDGRLYPWGNTKVDANLPNYTTGNTYLGPEPVTAHAPAGDSPFNVSDLVGNVWQYTDEFQDEHTRSVLLRGGSNYRPSGSSWYFPNQPELNTHNKYFLFDDVYERAATIGVRCVKDAA